MSIIKRLIYLVPIIAILVSLVRAEEYHLPSNPVEGSRLFISKGCIKCHAIKGKVGTIGPDLGKVSIGGTLLDIAGIMWNHAPIMYKKTITQQIPWPQFQKGEMADILSYLATMQEKLK